jgi:hypothetical protein
MRNVERRAIVARLSLCLGVALTICLLFSAAADAGALISPKVIETNPVSSEATPATTTTPLVLGEAEPEDGIVTQVTIPSPFDSRGLTSAVKNPTQHPEYEIVVYGEAGCAGAPIGRGRADTFEETGVPVTVPPNSLVILSANQVDPVNPTVFSACSGALPYWEGIVPGGGSSGSGGGSGGASYQSGSGGSSGAVSEGVTTGKPEPLRLHMSPKAVANDNSPLVGGTALGAGTVLVYANGTCGGTPIAKGPAAQLGAGFTVQVADNTTTTFSAITVGGQRSGCSSPVTYVEDSTAPVTRVTMGPGVKTRKRKAVFRFADVKEDPPGTSFFCKVDKAKWKPCASPFRLNHLRLSRYVVRIRAVDLAGNAEKTGAKRIFKVVPTF